MSFVKTNEELESYYKLRVREFPQARIMGVMFKADAGLTRRLLPSPLEQSAMPGGLLFIAEYGDTNLGPGYREAALFLRCSYEGKPGNYCLSMPIDSNASRLHNGRDIYGFPKKAAKIHLEHSGNKAHGWVERNGIRFVELSVTTTGTLPALPPSGPTYLFKGMPKADLTPGFDGPVLLVSQQTEVEAKSVKVGTAELKFSPSESDPWSELKDLEPMMSFIVESSNRMLPGKVLAEVDAETYLPHYFRMTDFYCGSENKKMADFSLSSTQQEFVQMAREFGKEVLGPAEVAIDRMHNPQDAFASKEFKGALAGAFGLGFHKMTLPEKVGGLALDPCTTGLIWEELARYGVGISAGLMAGAVVPGLICFLAPHNKSLIERYVIPFCEDTTGERITAWGSSEPNVGSDGKRYGDPAIHHHTSAKRTPEGFTLDGTKSNFVSNAGIADSFVIFGCVDSSKGLKGSGAFVVPSDAKGVSRGVAEDRVGLRALNQASVSLDEVDIPEDHQIFPPGEMYPMLHHAIMTVGNLGTGYLAVGLMRAAFEDALAYAKERVQGGKPIIEHQLVAKKLFDAHAAIESARALLWKGSWHASQQFPGDLKTSVTAKILATRLAVKHTSEMVQVLGGYGIAKDYKLEKYMRDAALLTIMDGTNDTLMLHVTDKL